ncbi:MAG: LytTR family DNA-binding domain-containing protein [Prolixibacteraceae bacterium]|nr:LytTR family DNA-binding domain-containing protein [Prolixibacteraceae bacterium]
MKALVIEDEMLAARHLVSVLNEVGDIEIIDILDSIKSSVAWFENHPLPDLVFMDIHIADGSAFKIFDHVNITCPIIFTTAYDEYAVKAFKVNSIDYLLKPITNEAVEKAMVKLKTLSASNNIKSDIQQLIDSLKQEKSYKTHFLVSVKGDKMIPLLACDIAYIYIDSGIVIAKAFDGKSWNLDFTLDELAGKLNPNDFFRANRQFIISKNSIQEVDFWFNNRLSINLKVAIPEKILISRTRVTEFREWFDGK